MSCYCEYLRLPVCKIETSVFVNYVTSMDRLSSLQNYREPKSVMPGRWMQPCCPGDVIPPVLPPRELPEIMTQM